MRGTASIDGEVYATPSAAAVAKLVDSHGIDAAVARWFWMGERTLGSMARSGRAASGRPSTVVRARTWTDLEAAVAVEAAFALGSMRRGERAAGLTVENAGRGICQARGVEPPCISSEERGVATRLGRGAIQGDAEAVAARDARHAFERAVGAVLRAALALVPGQPSTGRYRLPPQDARLAEALAGHDAAAVAAVFPGLAAVEPAQPEPPAPVPVPPPTIEVTPMPVRKLPADVHVLAERNAGVSAIEIAGRYGVHANAVYKALHRARTDAPAEAPLEPAPPSEPVPAAPIPSAPLGDKIWDHGTREASEPLSVADLARAVRLARLAGLEQDEALSWVRADIAQSIRRKAAGAAEIEKFFVDLINLPEDHLHG